MWPDEGFGDGRFHLKKKGNDLRELSVFPKSQLQRVNRHCSLFAIRSNRARPKKVLEKQRRRYRVQEQSIAGP